MSGALYRCCLLYTSDAADEEDSVDLGGRRIIKKKRRVLKRKFDSFHAAPTQESTESIKAPSLNDMVIKEVMEWECGSNPEPHLINKIIKCEKLYKDVRSLLQQTLYMLKGKLDSFYAVSAQEGEVTVPSKKDDKYKKFCHFFNNQNSCKKEDSCKFRHEDSPMSEQDKDCANRICQFKHSEKLKPQEAQSLIAQVVMGEVTAPLRKEDRYKKFFHFFSNQNSCKKGDSCKFRHEDSPRCEQDKDCANRICQFKHSGKLKPREAQSLGTQVVVGEVTAPLRKDDKYKKFCHFFNNRNSCKEGIWCTFRHEDSPRCEHWNF